VGKLLASCHKYVLKSITSFNNWPMVMIILLSSICCLVCFVAFKIIGVGSTFGYSTTDGNLAHLVDQDGSKAVVTSYGGSYDFSSFYNSWTISTINYLKLSSSYQSWGPFPLKGSLFWKINSSNVLLLVVTTITML
jgi:hypothetical protein